MENIDELQLRLESELVSEVVAALELLRLELAGGAKASRPTRRALLRTLTGACGAHKAWPALDVALARHLTVLPISALLDAFAVTFQDASDDFAAALVAFDEIAQRGDVAAHRSLVALILGALEGYDSGHRPREETVFDRLIDERLEKLEPEALADLLAELDDDHLSEDGDGFGRLLAPALRRAEGGALQTRLLRIGLGDREPKSAIAPTAKERATLEREILAGTLQIGGRDRECAEQCAKVRGARFDRDTQISFLCLLIPETNRDEPELRVAVDLLWELAEADFAKVRARLASWKLRRRDLLQVLRAASRRDDEGDAFEGRPLLAELGAWADRLEGKSAAPTDAELDAEVAARVDRIVRRRPSREARARHWLAQARGAVTLPNDGANALRRLLKRLRSLELHEVLLAWFPYYARLGLLEAGSPSFDELVWVIEAAACLGRRDLLSELEAVVPRHDRDASFSMYRSMLSLRDGDRAVTWASHYLAAGGDPSSVVAIELDAFGRGLAALTELVDGASERLRRAEFEGVCTSAAETRIALFHGRPEIEPSELEERVASSSSIAELAAVLLGEGARFHRRLLEKISASESKVELDERDLVRLLERLLRAGNASAVLEWTRALPKLDCRIGELLALGLAASAQLKRTEEEALLLSLLPRVERRPGSLWLELARLHARRGDRAQVLACCKGIAATHDYEAKYGEQGIKHVGQDPALRPYAGEIRALPELAALFDEAG